MLDAWSFFTLKYPTHIHLKIYVHRGSCSSWLGNHCDHGRGVRRHRWSGLRGDESLFAGECRIEEQSRLPVSDTQDCKWCTLCSLVRAILRETLHRCANNFYIASFHHAYTHENFSPHFYRHPSHIDTHFFSSECFCYVYSCLKIHPGTRTLRAICIPSKLGLQFLS